MNHTGTRELATGRLTLRRFEIEDAENFYYNLTGEKEAVTYMKWQAHTSADVTQHEIESWIGKYEQKDFYRWAIELNELEQPIGSIEAVTIDEKTESVRIGYCIGTQFRKQGYEAEAVREVVRFFQAEVLAMRVWAGQDAADTAFGKPVYKKWSTIILPDSIVKI